MKKIWKATILCFALGMAAIAFAGCEAESLERFLGREPNDIVGFSDFSAARPNALANQLAQPKSGEYIAVMYTNHGEVHIRLFPQYAPLAVRNFVTHAQNGYYDGVTFHRVIQDFMIQGGDPIGDGGVSIWGEPFGNEVSRNLVHARGALSMANRDNAQWGITQTNTSQFFIVDAQAGTHWLNGAHTVFGQVFYGMDVVDAIAAVEVIDPTPAVQNYRPVEDVIIERIEIRAFE
ncbi:MAG: peptidylprolyl isomerase [Defluviitaleaceae bacterium]|nr:peptidylprolyl isomerase [Defluviitaleaceae bacterium]